MQLSYAALALAVLSLPCALAQPAHQRHHHKHKRGRPDAVQARGVDFSNKDLYKDVDWSSVFSVLPAAATPVASPPETFTLALPTSTPSPPETFTSALPTTTPSLPTESPNPPKENEPEQTKGKTDSDKSDEAPKVDGPSKGFGGQSDPVDDGNQDHYIGNVGIPYGSNMIIVDESEKGNYKYTLTLSNIDNAETTYIIWNKSGKDGQPQSGMGLEPNLKFTVGPKKSQVIAFDENSQISFSRDCERNKLGGNLPDCTWGEADFGDLRNGGWSGYDCSSIPNSKGNVDYCKMSCEGGKTSSQDSNSFTDASQTNAGGSLAPGPVAFYAEL